VEERRREHRAVDYTITGDGRERERKAVSLTSTLK